MERLIAVIALACLVGFMAIVLGFVTEPDLIVITIIVLVMAGYDFYLQLFRKPKDPKDR